MLAGFAFWGIAARKQAVHLIRHGLRGAAQFRCQGNMFTLPGFFIKDFPFRHLAHQHFFQRHGLCAELQTVGIVYLAAAMLIFHGHGLPQAAAALQ